MLKFEDDGTCRACRDEPCNCDGDNTYLADGNINHKDCRLIICECCGAVEEHFEKDEKLVDATGT